MRTIAITGATGFLGQALVRHFRSANNKVIALVRTFPQDKINGVEYVLFDLSTGNSSAGQIEADVLIHAAYIAISDNQNALYENIEGTKKLLGLFPGGTKKIFISSLSADENSPSAYGRQKATIENLFLKQRDAVIRPGLILGNGGLFARMRDYLTKKKTIPVFAGGKQPVQTVFITDVVFAIEQMIIKDLKGVYTFCEDEPVPYKTFYRELARQLEVQPHFLPIPYWVAGMLIHLGKFLGLKLPVNRDNLEGLKHMRRHPSANDTLKIGVIPTNYKENILKVMRTLLKQQ